MPCDAEPASQVIVIATTASRDEARVIACDLVERGLAAAAHVSEVESFYRWQGEVRREGEFRVLHAGAVTSCSYSGVYQIGDVKARS